MICIIINKIVYPEFYSFFVRKKSFWLDHAKNTLQGKVVALPVRDDIDFPVEEHLIVELYSK